MEFQLLKICDFAQSSRTVIDNVYWRYECMNDWINLKLIVYLLIVSRLLASSAAVTAEGTRKSYDQLVYILVYNLFEYKFTKKQRSVKYINEKWAILRSNYMTYKVNKRSVATDSNSRRQFRKHQLIHFAKWTNNIMRSSWCDTWSLSETYYLDWHLVLM